MLKNIVSCISLCTGFYFGCAYHTGNGADSLPLIIGAVAMCLITLINNNRD